MLLGASGTLHADEEPLGLRVEATATADNNVTRSKGADKLGDTALGVGVSKSLVVPLSEYVRLTVLGTAGADRFSKYSGLSKVYAGANAEFQYRPSGEFDAPTFGVFADGRTEQYQSKLRDGYRYSVGARVLQPLSTSLDLFAAVAYNWRDGKSAVFDDKDYSIRFNLDYAVGAGGTLYGGGEFRRGDIVSTAKPALAYLDVADATVRDDVFTDPLRISYRLRANTVSAAAGYNLALKAGHSIDVSLRWVRSTSLDRPTYPGADLIRYYDVQAGIAYLVAF
jgi:hypothetical protein